MAIFLFSNFAQTSLAAPISNSALSLTVQSGSGALFPNPSAGQQFALILNDAATGLLYEIVYVTARTGDTMTILRAQEATVALSWLAGDLADNGPTAGQMAGMQQSAALFPARIVTTSGPFALSTSDSHGGVGLQRTVAPAASSTTLPNGANIGDTYEIEDLASNFQAFPVTVSYPAGQVGPNGQINQVLNQNGQSAKFRFYGSNQWSFKP